MEVNKNLIQLIELLNSDAQKAHEFSSKENKKELYEYCISLVPGYSEAEFTEFMKNLSSLLKNKNNMSKISEKDLENVSGGSSGVLDSIWDILYAFQEGKAEGSGFFGKINDFYPDV